MSNEKVWNLGAWLGIFLTLLYHWPGPVLAFLFILVSILLIFLFVVWTMELWWQL